MTDRSWDDLSEREKRIVYVLGALELVITAAAIVDLAKRPASEVNGPKWAWVLSLSVQPFGPLSYFGFGRRRQT